MSVAERLKQGQKKLAEKQTYLEELQDSSSKK